MKAYIVRCANSGVTDYYLDMIAEMLKRNGFDVSDYNNVSKVNKKDVVVVAAVSDFFRIYRKGYKKIVFWMQGIIAEESFLNHKSYLRKFALDFLTKLALKKSAAIFYVSETMREYEDKKFKISTFDRSFVIPCFNIELDENAIKTKNKYERNIFTYMGSLSKWQCFDETAEYYSKIEKIIPDAEFRVFTQDKEAAVKILEAKHINHYSIDYVSADKVSSALSEIKFGFVLRDDIAVNQVATPTKLSSYTASGVIPVFSECLHDFAKATKDMKYVVPVDNIEVISDKLTQLCSEKISSDDVLAEYKQLYDDYYSRNKYILGGTAFLRSLLGTDNG